MNQITDRWVPISIEAEQCLLGAILVNNEALRFVADILTPDHFGEALHGFLFEKIKGQIDAGRLSSPTTLMSIIPDQLLFEGMSTRKYLARLCAEATTIINARDFALTIRDLAKHRELMLVADRIKVAEPCDVLQLASSAIDMIDGVVAEMSNRATRGMAASGMMAGAVEAAARAYEANGRIIGIPTGLTKLDRKLLGFTRGDLVIMGGRPGMGKAMPVDTPVLTPVGWRAIGALRIGDLVLNHAGVATKIVAVHPQGVKDVFEIGFADGRSALACADHLWEVRSKHWRSPRVINTMEVARRLDLVRYKKWLHIPLFSNDESPDVNLPVAPYTLGAWLGDGSRGSGRITGDDPEIFDRIEADGFKVGKPCGRARSVFGLAGALKGIGLFDRNSWDRFIPENYYAGSKEQRLNLIRGLLDTDGTVEPSGTVRYCSSSLRLAKAVRRLIWSVGGICKISLKKTARKDSYILSIRHSAAANLFTLNRKRMRLPKKYQYGEHLGLRIDLVRPAGREKCVCITIDDPRGLYVAEDYIVTHNSAVMTTQARTMAEAGYKGAIFSQEMSEIALGQRMIADKMFGTGPINYFNFRSGRFDERAFARITEAANEIAALPLRIEPQPSQTFSQIAAKARQFKRRDGLDFLFVDHLQIMQMADRYNTRNDQIGEITSGFKALAKELDIVVILLCQLSRALEARENKRPTLGDLRDSGNIEQDADVVIMLYREMYYLERRQPPPGTPEHAVWQTSVTRAENRLEMLIEKQRAGPTGTIEVFCNIGCNAVRDLDEHEVLATAASGASLDPELAFT